MTDSMFYLCLGSPASFMSYDVERQSEDASEPDEDGSIRGDHMSSVKCQKE